MPLPVPVLDHAVINVRDGLDEAVALWARLGFMLTPRGHHTLGSSNHLAVLGTDYLELLGVQPGNARTDVLDWPAGLNGLAFKTYDADATHGGLHAAGLPVLPVQAFSRPVEAPGGAQDAAFRTVGMERDAEPAGRLFFCQHLTPGLVWQDAWQRHATGRSASGASWSPIPIRPARPACSAACSAGTPCCRGARAPRWRPGWHRWTS